MNESEAENAIQQMINFIDKEAQDRAEEIRKKTDEECTIGKAYQLIYMLEKGNMISEARKKMKVEFEKRLEDYRVQKKMYGFYLSFIQREISSNEQNQNNENGRTQ
jgi:hypothetical protein